MNGNQLKQEQRQNEWAVILAGGDGTRLKSLTRQIAGDERPKQFCPVMGRGTLLEETQRRAALEIEREQIMYVVNQLHGPYYASILADEPTRNLIVQPRNRGTAPAILYSLLRIAERDPKALVAFFPSDHYISDNQKFMAHIRTALNTVRRREDLVVLLGLEPESPEVEYGWIEPAGSIPGNRQVCSVRRFWEKPNQMLAQVLQLRGCLWNSFVMVASVRGLLEIIEQTLPKLYRMVCLPDAALRQPRRSQSDQPPLRTNRRGEFLPSGAGRMPPTARRAQSHRRSLERSRRAQAGHGVAQHGGHPAPLGGSRRATVRLGRPRFVQSSNRYREFGIEFALRKLHAS